MEIQNIERPIGVWLAAITIGGLGLIMTILGVFGGVDEILSAGSEGDRLLPIKIMVLSAFILVLFGLFSSLAADAISGKTNVGRTFAILGFAIAFVAVGFFSFTYWSNQLSGALEIEAEEVNRQITTLSAFPDEVVGISKDFTSAAQETILTGNAAKTFMDEFTTIVEAAKMIGDISEKSSERQSEKLKEAQGRVKKLNEGISDAEAEKGRAKTLIANYVQSFEGYFGKAPPQQQDRRRLIADLQNALSDECGFAGDAPISFSEADRLLVFQGAPETPKPFSAGQIVPQTNGRACGGRGQLERARAALNALSEIFADIPTDLCASLSRARGAGSCTRETGVALLFLTELQEQDERIARADETAAALNRQLPSAKQAVEAASGTVNVSSTEVLLSELEAFKRSPTPDALAALEDDCEWLSELTDAETGACSASALSLEVASLAALKSAHIDLQDECTSGKTQIEQERAPIIDTTKTNDAGSQQALQARAGRLTQLGDDHIAPCFAGARTLIRDNPDLLIELDTEEVKFKQFSAGLTQVPPPFIRTVERVKALFTGQGVNAYAVVLAFVITVEFGVFSAKLLINRATPPAPPALDSFTVAHAKAARTLLDKVGPRDKRGNSDLLPDFQTKIVDEDHRRMVVTLVDDLIDNNMAIIRENRAGQSTRINGQGRNFLKSLAEYPFPDPASEDGADNLAGLRPGSFSPKPRPDPAPKPKPASSGVLNSIRDTFSKGSGGTSAEPTPRPNAPTIHLDKGRPLPPRRGQHPFGMKRRK
ncbi:Yip1 family protein [Puniceibacterium sediminis]|uniref:Uncharacterized protein n=1 Tax=Puniceibacterium sediminis TaxID=1608407 RepID=A0A238YWE7_9RHOB|nr:YIP1 family protein [Puniceibacterium sediminis]SNR74839.1 hypothetical protein SAMN06265370_12035 [Puniceibacterium sediminis]